MPQSGILDQPRCPGEGNPCSRIWIMDIALQGILDQSRCRGKGNPCPRIRITDIAKVPRNKKNPRSTFLQLESLWPSGRNQPPKLKEWAQSTPKIKRVELDLTTLMVEAINYSDEEIRNRSLHLAGFWPSGRHQGPKYRSLNQIYHFGGKSQKS